MDVPDTIHIDLTVVLQAIAAKLLTVADVYVHHLGLPPREAGDAARDVRVKAVSMEWADARRATGDGDEATATMVLTFSAGSNAEGGGLMWLAMMFNSIKGTLDRQPVVDLATTHRADLQVGAMQISDNAEAGAEDAAHQLLTATCTVRARVIRVSGTTITTAPPGP